MLSTKKAVWTEMNRLWEGEMKDERFFDKGKLDLCYEIRWEFWENEEKEVRDWIEHWLDIWSGNGYSQSWDYDLSEGEDNDWIVTFSPRSPDLDISLPDPDACD
jgi:hypothetical protein